MFYKVANLGLFCALLYKNDLPIDLQQSELSAKIEEIIVSCLRFADDIVLVPEYPKKLQTLIIKYESWAK